jgi:repressor LexA
LRLPDNLTSRADTMLDLDEDYDDESPKFTPNVIRGDFTGRIQAVRAANDAAAVKLPLYGRIAAGLPIEALRDTSTMIDVPASLLGPGDHYALEVSGDSMVDAGILDGDTVLIRKGDVAENGQIVVALVDDVEVTLKRLRRRGNSTALEPCNRAYKPQILPADKVKVQGRLVGLLRRY